MRTVPAFWRLARGFEEATAARRRRNRAPASPWYRNDGAGGRWALRLLCDEMLKGIGRWLRAAGYDTAIAQDGVADEDLLARSC